MALSPSEMRHLTLLSLLALSVVASAQNLSYTTIVRGMVDGDLQERYYENDPELKTLEVVGSTGSSLSRARIAPGVNSVYASYSSLDPTNPAGMLMSDAQTYWTDTVLISDPDLDGTLGYFTANIRVFGAADFTMSGAYSEMFSDAYLYGFWDSWIGTSTDGGGSFLVGGWFGDWYSDGEGNVIYTGDELNQETTEVTLEFIYGQPFLLRMNMEAYTHAENTSLLPGTVSAQLDFSHTAYWNGMGGIYDSNGVLQDPDFWSQSGVDWRLSVVPEPATFAALGLGAVALLRRRRSRE